MSATATATAAPPRLRLPGHVECPPGGLAYKIQDLSERAPGIAWVTGYHTFFDLHNEVTRRCRANGIAPPTADDIEDQVCQRQPPGYCVRVVDGRPSTHAGSMALGLADVVAGTKALVGWFRHGPVAVEEIARRTSICNACPENRPISGCQGCAGRSLHSVMNAIVVRPLPSDAVLHACTICHCSLKAKVRMRLDDLPPLTPEQQARLPEPCWLNATPTPTRNDPRL